MNPDEYETRRKLSFQSYNKLADLLQKNPRIVPPFLNSGFLYIGDQPDIQYNYIDKPSFDNCLVYTHLFEYIDPKDKEVLEVGCGFGRGCNFIKKQYNTKSVVGCDINDNVLKVAKKHFPLIKFVNGNAVKLQQLNTLFDIVVTVETLLYWDCHSDSFGSFASCIKEGGSLLIASDIRRSDTTLDKNFLQHGLRLVNEQDITANVILAIERAINNGCAAENDAKKHQLFQTKYRYVSKHYTRE